MPQTRSDRRSTTSSVLHNCDVLHVMTSFLNIKDVVNISHTSKKMSAIIDEVALRIVASSHLRYGGDEENLSALKLLKLLLHSPIEFASLLGERLEYVRGDKSCVHSSNPNPLHTPNFIGYQTMMGDWDGWEGESVTAMCSDYIMTSGKHYAKFTLSVSCNPGDLDFRYFYPRIGIMRPLKSFFREAPWPDFDPMVSSSH